MPSQIKAKQIRSKAITEKLNYEFKNRRYCDGNPIKHQHLEYIYLIFGDNWGSFSILFYDNRLENAFAFYAFSFWT